MIVVGVVVMGDGVEVEGDIVMKTLLDKAINHMDTGMFILVDNC